MLVALVMAGVLFAGQTVSVGETFVPNEPDEPTAPPAPEPEPEPEESEQPSIGPLGSEVGMEPAGSGAEPEAYAGTSGSPSGGNAASEETPAPCIAGLALLALAAFALKR